MSRSRSRPGDADLLRAAEQELTDVRQAEQAWLLCQAAGLRGTLSPPRELLALPPFLPTSALEWRERAGRVLALARVDQAEGGAVSAAERRATELLGELAAAPVARWPAASELARTAFELRRDERTRLALGSAWLAEDEPRLALECFRDLLRGETGGRWRGSALEGLAAAQARLGRARLALGAFDEAADEPDSSPLALVGALYFALRLAEAGRARRAAARLDLLVDPTRPAFRAALARLRHFVASIGVSSEPEASSEPGEAPVRDDGALAAALVDCPRSPAGRVWAALH